MTKYFKKLSAESLMPTEDEEKQLCAIAKEIEKQVFAERKSGGTFINVDIDVWKNAVFRYFLTKELLQKKIMVNPPTGKFDTNMKISWCNEDILAIHRKRRIDLIEESITEKKPTFSFRETNNAPFFSGPRTYRNMLGIPASSDISFGHDHSNESPFYSNVSFGSTKKEDAEKPKITTKRSKKNESQVF